MQLVAAVAVAATASAFQACGGTSSNDATTSRGTSGAGGAAPASGLPCDVDEIFRVQCQSCHGKPPKPGVPVSLVTYDDLAANDPIDPTRTVGEQVVTRVSMSATHPGRMPAAPNPPLSSDQIATLTNWVGAGMPRGTCDAGGSGGSSGGSAGAAPTGGSAGATSVTGLPCDLAMFLATKCDGCHSSPPAGGAWSPMTTYAELVAPSVTDPTKTVAQIAVGRLNGSITPTMPPIGYPQATPAEVQAFADWVSMGTPMGSCTTGAGGATMTNPYDTPITCSSKVTIPYSGPDSDGYLGMDPGAACISCHTQNDGPQLWVAGTVYKTAHEPDQCAGGVGGETFQIVVTDATGKQWPVKVESSTGNFALQYAPGFAYPYAAKVVRTSDGAERHMVATQMSGDCNGCHTEMGMGNSSMAPGRIMAP